MLAAGAAQRREVHLAARKPHFARLLAVHVHGRVGIQVLRGHSDAAAGPLAGDGDLPLVPGRGDAAQVLVLPARMGIDRLAVLLHVVGDSRPAAGNLEIAPLVGGHHVRDFPGRLPAPQAIQANSLAGRGLLPVGLVQIPNSLDSTGELRVGLYGRNDA